MTPFALAALGIGVVLGDAPAAPVPDSVIGGWQVFARKQCISCHAVWGLGGQIGPDLGRTERQGFTAGRLAGTMWNHIPKMYSHMLRNHLVYPRLNEDEMGELFSFLLFVPYLDEPGDPGQGQRVLREKGCIRCHSTESPQPGEAPDLKRWAAYANPIVWAQKMWEHAPKMEQAMQKAGMNWPKLDDPDLLNIMAYIRSVGEHEPKTYLQPGSAGAGARLFDERSCRACHSAGGAGGDLSTKPLPRSLAALASRMWNHSPEMTRLMQSQGIQRSPLSAQEMADIIAYIISLRYQDRGGDPRRGRVIFEDMHCAQCHGLQKTADTQAPTLETLGAASTPIRLAHAMWNHGVTMMDRMSQTGIPWPVFQSDDMIDLIAYLKSVAPKAATAAPAIPAASVPAIPLLRPPPIQIGASCVSNNCHPALIAGREVHAPTAHGECSACHELVDARSHRFKLVSTQSDLCHRCHEDRGESLQGHGPVAVGVCTACHNPHSDENLLGPGFTGSERCFAEMIGMTMTLETLVSGKSAAAPIGVPVQTPVVTGLAAMSSRVAPPARLQGGCVTSECHATTVSGRFVHGPAAQQQCQTCHLVIDEKNHRFKLADKLPELCYQCHDRPGNAAFTHGPVALGMCTACHNPHSAPYKLLLPEEGNNLCFMCHTEIQDIVKNARVQHRAITEKGCVSCHDPHLAQTRFQLKKEVPDLCLGCHTKIRDVANAATVHHEPMTSDKKCGNCHNPHGSNVPSILNDVEMNLCLSCHNRPMDTPNGSIIDMASWIKNNPERHGPIRNANCTGCHQPHGSKNFRILQYSFPREFYRPFSLGLYELCFQCHEQTLVLDPRTTSLTGFRNGDKNLHYLHVNQEKGRTCRACHEIHAGTKPKRIKDFVPFGTWKYPVNFEKDENGGRCAPGCHVPRAYDRRHEISQK